MRLLLLASAATLLGGAVFAQSLLGQSQPGQGAAPPAIVVPPPPPIVSAPSVPVPVPAPAPPSPPPGLVQTPLPPPAGNADNGSGSDQTTQMQAVSPSAPAPAQAATAAQPAPQDVPPALSNDWVPGKSAVLGVLNKVDGSISTLTIPVGGQAVAGDLTVSVQACVSRPPNELPDSAIFLTLQPKAAQAGSPVYRGWVVRSTPGAADAGNAGQAFRVITCS